MVDIIWLTQILDGFLSRRAVRIGDGPHAPQPAQARNRSFLINTTGIRKRPKLGQLTPKHEAHSINWCFEPLQQGKLRCAPCRRNLLFPRWSGKNPQHPGKHLVHAVYSALQFWCCFDSAGRHCQTNLSRLAKGASQNRSGRQLTPLGHCGRTVLFENIAAVEVAVLIEVVVDRGMGGGEFLQGLFIPEPGHRSFPSSERLV